MRNNAPIWTCTVWRDCPRDTGDWWSIHEGRYRTSQRNDVRREQGPATKGERRYHVDKAIMDMILKSGKRNHDNASACEPPESVWWFLLYSRNWRWDSDYQHQKIAEICFSGLILEKIGNEDQYRRIGSLFDQRRNWVGYWDRQTVTII